MPYEDDDDQQDYQGGPLKRLLATAGLNPSSNADLVPPGASASGGMVVPTGVDSSGRTTLGLDRTTAIKDSPTAAAVGSMATSPDVQSPKGIGGKLASLSGPPKAPEMNPEFSKVNEDLRQAEAPLNRQDPKYKLGIGGRILRTVSNLFSGGIPGALNAAINPNAPGYVGPGATNNQFARDEAARQRQVAADTAQAKSMQGEYDEAEKGYKNALSSYNDDTRRAYESDKNEINQQRDKDRADYQQQIADVRQQLADAKDPETKMRAEIKARTAILKDPDLGLSTKLTPEQQTRYIMYGDKSAMDDTNAARLKALEERLDIMRDKNEIDREKANRAGAKDQTAQRTKAETEKESELFKLEQQFKKDFSKAKDDNERDNLTKKLNEDKARVQGAYEAKLAQIPGEQQPPENVTGKPAPAAAPAPTPGIPEAKFDPRTGKPIQQPAPAAQSDLTPVKDQQVTSPGGKVYKVGQVINGKPIKSFSKDKNGKFVANF